MLKCRNISYHIAQEKILHEINFKLNLGDNLLVLGDSGAGKTSLISIICGLLKPTCGVILFDDKNLYEMSQTEIDKFRSNNIGIIFQDFHLIKNFTVKENLLLAQKFSHNKIDEDEIFLLLEDLNMSNKIQQKAKNLSRGEMQRLSIARAFINKAKYIFCDEPTASLDDKNATKTIKILQDQAKKNKSSLIIATHDHRLKTNFCESEILKL